MSGNGKSEKIRTHSDVLDCLKRIFDCYSRATFAVSELKSSQVNNGKLTSEQEVAYELAQMQNVAWSEVYHDALAAEMSAWALPATENERMLKVAARIIGELDKQLTFLRLTAMPKSTRAMERVQAELLRERMLWEDCATYFLNRLIKGN